MTQVKTKNKTKLKGEELRHEDDIRHGECKQRISRMVNKDELLGNIVNFGFYFSNHFLREGDKIAGEILGRFNKFKTIS